MKNNSAIPVLIAIALAVVLALAPFAFAQKDPSHAEVHFGSDSVGSPFPPPTGHDHSGNASHKMFPRTVTISRGGSVTFEVYPVHQPAIYAPGKDENEVVINDSTLEDLSLPPCIPEPIPDFVINDPSERVALAPPQTCEEMNWTTPDGTFDQPGRYLVICTTHPHFVEDQMFGWVIVR
jgi:hypothetical protein